MLCFKCYSAWNGAGRDTVAARRSLLSNQPRRLEREIPNAHRLMNLEPLTGRAKAAGDHVKKRGLTGTIRSDDGMALSSGNIQVHVSHSGEMPEPLSQAANL